MIPFQHRAPPPDHRVLLNQNAHRPPHRHTADSIGFRNLLVAVPAHSGSIGPEHVGTLSPCKISASRSPTLSPCRPGHRPGHGHVLFPPALAAAHASPPTRGFPLRSCVGHAGRFRGCGRIALARGWPARPCTSTYQSTASRALRTRGRFFSSWLCGIARKRGEHGDPLIPRTG